MVKMVNGVPIIVTPADGGFYPKLSEIEKVNNIIDSGNYSEQSEQSIGSNFLRMS